jgi:NDP-sugar pyrophosphorylase family protein
MTGKIINHALVMAAGRGLRMRPLTDSIPKAMAPVGQSTLIAEGIHKLKQHIDNVHITVGYKGAMLARHVIEKDVSSVINTEGKGNAWWVYNTLIKNLNEPIFVLTCDNIIDMDFSLFSNEYIDKGSPACMIIPVRPVKGIDGDFIYKDNKSNILEISRKIPTDLYCSGIQVINPKKVNNITNTTESFNCLWNELIKKKEIICSNNILEKWLSIDDLTQLDAINKHENN